MKRQIYFITVILSLLFFPMFAFAQKTFVHPGIPFTSSDLAQLKANITKDPWLKGYTALLNDSKSKLTYTMQGPFATVTRAPDLNNGAWKNDMVAIHNLAFMWVFTGNDAYAAKATQMLDSWAVANTTWGGNESMLDIGDYAPYFVPAADILKSTYSGWTADNTTHVNNYFANVLYPTSWVPSPLRDCNKGALQLEIALSIAAFLDDEAKWNDAIEVYRMDAGGGLRNSLPNGEVGDTGRDDHWFEQIQALGWGAEVAWKQGVDMFAEFDNRLLAIGELYNHYAIDPTGLTFTNYGGYSVYWGNGWGIPTGARHQHPFNNIIQAAYSLRKGMATPYTDQMRILTDEGEWSFLYYKSSDASTATPMTPIIYPSSLTVPVSYFTNTDIGTTGIKGSAIYNAGTWTLQGAGTSVASSANYTFKPVKGNVAIIAKIEGNSINSSNSGLIIRESLSTTSNYVSVNLLGAGGMSSSAAGSSAQTVYAHAGFTAPWWLKLERVGNRVFTYHSQDGVNWTNNALYIMSLPEDVYIGLYTVSNNTSVLNTATFANVAINNTFPVGSPEINNSTTVNATVGTTFNFAVTATETPASYSATGLPSGLNIDAATGIISGTPAVAGKNIVTLGATNAAGTGTSMLIINVLTNIAPTSITNLSASVINSTAIRLSWSSSTDATSYTVKRSLTAGGPYITIQSGITGTYFVDASPEFEVNNYYVITALSGELESNISNEVFASVAPGVPSNLVAVSKSGQVDLTWDIAPGALTYKIKRGTVSGGPYTLINIVSTKSYTDADVTSGNPYYYVISSMGKAQESANSIEVFGVPGSSSVTWSPTSNGNTLNLASNWIENTLPVNPAIISFGTSSTTALINDIVGMEASRIQFNSGGSSYNIGGNGIILKNDLVNNSAAADTLTMPLTLTNQLNVYANTSSLRLSGVVSGLGSILKRGTSALYMTGNNTYSGNTIIKGTIGYLWGSTDGIVVTGIGTGTSGAPLSGPLGTGTIIMNGGSLSTSLMATADAATLYNDINVPAGQTGYFYERMGNLNLYGKLTGSGNIVNDGADNYATLQLYGDNSGYSGTFTTKMRSGHHRLAFMVPESGSKNATWLLDANSTDCQSIKFANGTLNLGALTGRGYIRSDVPGLQLISIGALGTSTNYQGTMASVNGSTLSVEKVGKGTLTFSGNNIYTGSTTVQEGTLLMTASTFKSPIVVRAGAFGGTGTSIATVTIGTGLGSGAAFVPGTDGTIGRFTTTAFTTLNADATYKVDLKSSIASSDTIITNGITINNAVLSINDLTAAAASGANFMIVKNTSASAVTGIFKNLTEQSIITINGLNYTITYKGGDGNDIVLSYSGIPTSTIALDSETLSIYPNPVKDNLTIAFGRKSVVPFVIQLFDINGQVKCTETIKGSNTYELNMRDLPSGIYFLKIEGLAGMKKIIKL